MTAPSRHREREHSIATDVRELHRRLGAGDPLESGAAGPAPAAPRVRRRELYVLLSVCAQHVVPDFIAATPPSLVADLAREPRSEVSALFHDALLETIAEFFAAHPTRWRDGPRPSSIAPLLARVDEIGPGASGVLDKPSFHYAEQLLKAGMSSVAPVAPAIVSAIIDLVGAMGGLGSTPAEIGAVARRSVGVPARLAALDLATVRQVQRGLIDETTVELRGSVGRRLEGEPGRERLELDIPEPGRPDVIGAWPLPAAYGFTIGCPALVRVNASHPLEELWGWSAEAAVQSGYVSARCGLL